MAIDLNSELLNYLANGTYREGDRLPAISELSTLLGISTGKLREQLEVARTLGLVEVRPKTGIRVLPYDFEATLHTGLFYALARDPGNFEPFGMLRNHVEAAYWHQATALLTTDDLADLQTMVDRAWMKLRGEPVQIPHAEHRQLHMIIYRRLENPFVLGVLEAYWAAYEAVGLDLYNDYRYLEEVWGYHEKMVHAIAQGDYDAGYRALVEHAGLLRRRPAMNRSRPPSVEEMARAR